MINLTKISPRRRAQLMRQMVGPLESRTLVGLLLPSGLILGGAWCVTHSFGENSGFSTINTLPFANSSTLSLGITGDATAKNGFILEAAVLKANGSPYSNITLPGFGNVPAAPTSASTYIQASLPTAGLSTIATGGGHATIPSNPSTSAVLYVAGSTAHTVSAPLAFPGAGFLTMGGNAGTGHLDLGSSTTTTYISVPGGPHTSTFSGNTTTHGFPSAGAAGGTFSTGYNAGRATLVTNGSLTLTGGNGSLDLGTSSVDRVTLGDGLFDLPNPGNDVIIRPGTLFMNGSPIIQNTGITPVLHPGGTNFSNYFSTAPATPSGFTYQLMDSGRELDLSIQNTDPFTPGTSGNQSVWSNSGGAGSYTYSGSNSSPQGATITRSGTASDSYSGTPVLAFTGTRAISTNSNYTAPIGSPAPGVTLTDALTFNGAIDANNQPFNSQNGTGSVTSIGTPNLTFSGTINPPTGVITFKEGNTVLGTGSINSATGVASLHLATPLPAGPHYISANYAGDGGSFIPASAANYLFVTQGQTTTSLNVSAPVLSNDTAAITLTATTTTNENEKLAPTGTITFMEDNTPIATVPFTQQNVAVTLPLTSPGTHHFSAVYSGDDFFYPSSSSPNPIALIADGPQTVNLGQNPSDQNPQLITNTSVVLRLYHDLLHRPPSADELNLWTTQLDSGQTTPQAIASAFIHSDEYRTHLIQNLYQSVLGRGADSAGLSAWLSAFAAGTTLEQMKAQFYGSDEFFHSHGSSNAALVDTYYHTFLSRSPDSSGLAYWSDLLNQNTPRGDVASGIANTSTEGSQLIVQNTYQTYLHRAPDATGLRFWSDQIKSGSSETDIVMNIVGSPEYVNQN